MGKFLIGYGLSGGFGGIINHTIEECETEQEAWDIAYEYAKEYYEGYEGMYGLRSVSDIMEDDGVSEEEAEEIWMEEREGWLDYEATPYDEEKHKDLL